MGRRPKYSRHGAFTRLDPAAETPPEPASKLRGPVSGTRPSLEGWPPRYYCWACHTLSFSAEDIRRNFCDQCHAFVDELELSYLSAAAKVPKTQHGS